MDAKPKWTRLTWSIAELPAADLGSITNSEPGRPAWAVPSVALVEASRRDRLRGWIMRSGAEAAKLDPADKTGMAWSAVGLKVAHPERPHRLSLKVKGGEPAALGVCADRAGRWRNRQFAPTIARRLRLGSARSPRGLASRLQLVDLAQFVRDGPGPG